MENQNTPPSSPSFGERFGNALLAFLRALIRLLAVIVLATLLGVGLFYGIPLLYRQYVQPIQDSIAQLEQDQAADAQTNQQQSERLEALQGRINDLEVQNDTFKQTISQLESQLNQVADTQSAQGETLTELQMVFDERVAAIEGSLEDLNLSVEELEATLDSQEDELTEIIDGLDETSQQVQELSTQIEALQEPLSVARRELELVKAMEFLTRARLYLIEDNLGLAGEDIQAASNVLVELQGMVPSEQEESLASIIQELEGALENLPQNPVRAAGNLEVAWLLLQRGLTGETAETGLTAPESTGTVAPTEGTPTPTPTPIQEQSETTETVTPTVTATP